MLVIFTSNRRKGEFYVKVSSEIYVRPNYSCIPRFATDLELVTSPIAWNRILKNLISWDTVTLNYRTHIAHHRLYQTKKNKKKNKRLLCIRVEWYRWDIAISMSWLQICLKFYLWMNNVISTILRNNNNNRI